MAEDISQATIENVKPGPNVFNTPLHPMEEYAFRRWLAENKVSFDPEAPITDYDMRGFWRALMGGSPLAHTGINKHDNKLHYPDYWKTPLHKTFSNQSQWALPTAPHWQGDVLIDNEGNVIADERKKKKN